MRGLHDSPDYYPYYGYGHCRLEGEELSYDMTEAEAEKTVAERLDGALQAVPQVQKRRPAPYRSQLQCGVRGSARLRETSEKPAAEEAGSGRPGHLCGVYILLPLQGSENPLDRAATKNGISAAV